MPDPSRPTTDQLAEKVRVTLDVPMPRSEWDACQAALADLFALAKRTEQAEAALNMLQEAYDNASADRDEQVAAAEQAEKERDEALRQAGIWRAGLRGCQENAKGLAAERDQAEIKLQSLLPPVARGIDSRYDRLVDECDRLAAALERIGNQGLLAAEQRMSRAYLIQIAREALNPGNGE